MRRSLRRTFFRPECHIWVEFVFGSLPFSEFYSELYSEFSLCSKTNILNFQIPIVDPERNTQVKTLLTDMLPLYCYLFIYLFLFIHKMLIYLYIYSWDILLNYTFTARQDFEARNYPRIFCRALSDNSTDKDHLSKVVIYWRLSLSNNIKVAP